MKHLLPAAIGQTTAGTASDGYLVPDSPHRFVADACHDPGYTPRCVVSGCGRERGHALHAVPVPRRPEGASA